MESESTSVTVDEALRDRVIDTICSLLPRFLGPQMQDVSAETRMVELKLSSVSTLEIMLEVEDTLEIQVDVEDFQLDDMETIGRLATYVAGHALVG
jgi:acyl carrier protein